MKQAGEVPHTLEGLVSIRERDKRSPGLRLLEHRDGDVFDAWLAPRVNKSTAEQYSNGEHHVAAVF